MPSVTAFFKEETMHTISKVKNSKIENWKAVKIKHA